jgi:hypothetical protein
VHATYYIGLKFLLHKSNSWILGARWKICTFTSNWIAMAIMGEHVWSKMANVHFFYFLGFDFGFSWKQMPSFVTMQQISCNKNPKK